MAAGAHRFLPSIMLEVYANSHAGTRVGCLSAIAEMTDRPSREARSNIPDVGLALALELALALALALANATKH